jgi:DNA-binding response OmpR family regulator
MLQQEGYRVDIALNGTAALHALSEFHYDAVTIDLLLPDFSGLEVIRRIRTSTALAHISIIVVSAKLEAGQLMFSGDASTIEWLAKPVGRDQLRDAIEKRLHDTPIQRMLYVEDDVDLQYVIGAMAGKNYTVVPAATLAQARAALATQSFEVILLDIGLPDGSGWDFLPEIRAKLPDARVVMLSGEDLSRADVAKAEAVLLKSKMTERQLLTALEATPKAPKS